MVYFSTFDFTLSCRNKKMKGAIYMNINCLTSMEKKCVKNFFDLHPEIIQNPICISFFDHNTTVTLLAQTLLGDPKSKELLENEFKKHFFRIKFTGFISSLVRFTTIGYARKFKKNKERNLLLLDFDNTEEKFSNPFIFEYSLCLDQYFTQVKEFEQTILDDKLYLAWKTLKPNQKKLLILSFVESYKDNEIAKLLDVTPQAICKNKKRIIEKLRLNYKEKGLIPSGS